jgi:hypothetical protein
MILQPNHLHRLTGLQTFAKTDLPEEHRVVKENSFMTMDHNPNR